jgi:glutathione S-transferase
MAIVASQTTCQLREVSLAAKPAELLQISPKGTVPVMVVLTDGGEVDLVLEESLDIMAFVLARHDPKGWLDGVGDANMVLVNRNDLVFKYHLDRYKYPNRYQDDPLTSRALGLEILADLDDRLGEAGFLSGEDCTLIDAAIFPFVRQFAAVDAVWFARQALPHLHTWMAGLSASSIFNAAMVTFPKWQPNDEAMVFPAS